MRLLYVVQTAVVVGYVNLVTLGNGGCRHFSLALTNVVVVVVTYVNRLHWAVVVAMHFPLTLTNVGVDDSREKCEPTFENCSDDLSIRVGIGA
jgi:hypothetical protein